MELKSTLSQDFYYLMIKHFGHPSAWNQHTKASFTLRHVVQHLESAIVAYAMERHVNVQVKAADFISVNRATLHKIIKHTES